MFYVIFSYIYRSNLFNVFLIIEKQGEYETIFKKLLKTKKKKNIKRSAAMVDITYFMIDITYSK